MYNGDDRVQQVNWIHETAGNIRFGIDYGVLPEDQVQYYLNNYEIPAWFDDHDKGLLIEFVSD